MVTIRAIGAIGSQVLTAERPMDAVHRLNGDGFEQRSLPKLKI